MGKERYNVNQINCKTMSTQQKTSDTVVVNKDEYEALLHMAEVTSEYLSGKVKKSNSAEELIESLKQLDDHQ